MIHITILENPSSNPVQCVQLDKKTDLEIIVNTFDCYTNPAIPDEAILDTTGLDESETGTKLGIELFGEEGWSKLTPGFVLFHP